MQVAPISPQIAATIAEENHYMHRRPRIMYAFGLFTPATLIGIVTFGCPASHELRKGACPSAPQQVIEFNRLWIEDSAPRNTASWFVSRALKALPPYIIVSYADTAQNHLGYVYRAMNFHYAGWTDMDRKTPRYDYIPDRPDNPQIHTRDAARNGYTHRIQRKPKIKYWTTTGTKTQKKTLTAACAWPSLDWKLVPPPTDHRQFTLHRRQ